MKYGLSERESQVYIYLSKIEISKASEISRALKFHRTESYHILKTLQDRGLVERTLETPTRFIATPIEKGLAMLIEEQKYRLHELEASKNTILTQVQSLGIQTPPSQPEKFQIMKGKICLRKMSEIIQSAHRKVDVIITDIDFTRFDSLGIIDDIIDHADKTKVAVRLLTIVTEKNINEFENLSNIAVRHTDVTDAPRYLVVDDEVGMIFLKNSVSVNKETAMYTNNSVLIKTLATLMDELWLKGETISQIKTSLSQPGARIQIPDHMRQFRHNIQKVLTLFSIPYEEDIQLAGISDALHTFRLGVFAAEKPIVVDFQVTDTHSTEMSVIAFFSKLFDLHGKIENGIFIVTPGLNPETVQLAHELNVNLFEITDSHIHTQHFDFSAAG